MLVGLLGEAEQALFGSAELGAWDRLALRVAIAEALADTRAAAVARDAALAGGERERLIAAIPRLMPEALGRWIIYSSTPGLAANTAARLARLLRDEAGATSGASDVEMAGPAHHDNASDESEGA